MTLGEPRPAWRAALEPDPALSRGTVWPRAGCFPSLGLLLHLLVGFLAVPGGLLLM